MTLKSEILSQTEIDKLRYLDTLDWELQGADTRYATHGYHPYSAKYIPQIPNYLIKNFSGKNDVVLDNFMGSGTTLVESRILGRNALGVDINPLACLISKVKTTNLQNSELKEITTICGSAMMKQAIFNARGNITLVDFIEFENNNNNKRMATVDKSLTVNRLNPLIAEWYDESVIRELLVIKNRIDMIENKNVEDFLLVAFSSILRTVSKAKSGFGNLMINKNNITTAKTKIYEKFVSRVDEMVTHMLEFNKLCASTDSNVKVIEVFNHDTRDLSPIISDESIDFICTHPPYMAAVPYAEYQKLHLWWLGLIKPEILDKVLIGGQRSKPDTPDRFLCDMHKALTEMKRVLAKRKYCCITIGNPVYKGKFWALNEIIKNDAKDIGFTLVNEINRGKYKTAMGKMKEEFILVLRNA